MADGEVKGDVRNLRQMLAECEPYLKEGETPAQRIQRERRDTEAVLNLLIREKRKSERMVEALRLIASTTTDHGAREEAEQALGTDGVLEDDRCPACKGAEFPGWKRGMRCSACDGTSTAGVLASDETKGGA